MATPHAGLSLSLFGGSRVSRYYYINKYHTGTAKYKGCWAYIRGGGPYGPAVPVLPSRGLSPGVGTY
eukprot:7368991-Pyramimonas_sp.AAC.1